MATIDNKISTIFHNYLKIIKSTIINKIHSKLITLFFYNHFYNLSMTNNYYNYYIYIYNKTELFSAKKL